MFDWESIPAIIDVITQGLLWTVIISITSIIIGYIIGLATGFARAQHIRFLQTVSSVYVWLIRSTPILVQALYIYFVFPKLFGIRMGHEWRFPREAFMKAINTLAVTGELHRESPKRKAKAVATDKDKGSKTNRRNPIPELPTLRSVG